MKKRNVFIACIIIISLICIVPTLFTRIGFETSHNSFLVAPVITEDITKKELEHFKENDIDLVLTDETNSNFDKDLLETIKELGLKVALRINVGEKSTGDFEKNLDTVVKENNVKYILIAQNKKTKKFDAPLENVIKENNMTVVVCENMSQLSNEMPKGYTKCIEASDGKLMRCYTTLKNPAGGLNTDGSSVSLGELLYHHMANSLRDRNTEFMAVNIIENPSLTKEEAIDETIYAIKRFKQNAKKLGYEEGKDISLKGYDTNVKIPSCASVMLSFIMALISLEILFKKRIASLEWSFCVSALFSFGIIYILPERLTFFVPTVFAPLSASFAFSLSLGIMNYAKEKGLSLLSSLILTALSSLLSLLLGAVCLSAMLSGTEFYLNNLIFRGVKLSLVLPMMYAILFMCIFEKENIGKALKNIRNTRFKIKPFHIIISALALFAMFVYVQRSGNAKISPFENAFRNFVSDISVARPRTKEFVIGWPLLALSVYLTHYSSSKLLSSLTSVGCSVLFASVTNTFCHVFADFSISVMRTLNGLVFSIPIATILILISHLILKKLIRK